MTGWAATNTLRTAIRANRERGHVDDGYCALCDDEPAAAVALVETALDAAEETRELLSSIQAEAGHPIFGTYERLDAALRAVREGAA